MNKINNILIVDDEHLVRWSLTEILSEEGYTVSAAENCIEAREMMSKDTPDLLILDYMMPDMTGIELLEQLREEGNTIQVIMLTAVNDAQDAVRALKLGASNYLLKPVDLKELKDAIHEISISEEPVQSPKREVKRDTTSPTNFYGMVGNSAAMETVYTKLQVIAKSATMNVLITGESGTGKELAAQAIHALSNRANQNMLEVNCTALTETLFASELFGHVKGSFTDAKSDKTGLLVKADGGTLFLDEIGDLSMDVQAKLLRVLEDRKVTPVGSTQGTKVNVRIITATNQSLDKAVQEGRFRRDLLHRLDIARIHMPPLRDRPADIIQIAQHFIDSASQDSDSTFSSIHSSAIKELEGHAWPGNVRELKNVIERAVLFNSGDELLAEHLEFTELPQSGLDMKSSEALSLDEMEKLALIDALEKNDYNISAAARSLRISRDTLRYRMKKYDL